MLIELRIRNFAIIESLTLPLAPGFNVLSGETGAGKSIIVGALGLLLGERASADLIRTGQERATVEGVFDVSDRPALRAVLDEHGLEAEDSLIVLKREVAAGRARAWANGSSVTAAVLAQIGRQLVDLHGQHEAQSLLDPESQRAILDAFGDAAADAASVRDTFHAVSDIRREIADLDTRARDAQRRADYLRHVAKEIEEARLTEGEDARLEEEANRLENADELRALAGEALAHLSAEEQGALTRLGALERVLHQLQRLDPSLAGLQESYDAAYYALDAMARELERYQGDVDLDPQRLAQVRARRELLFDLVKKYGPALADVMQQGREARRELDLVDSSGLELRTLRERLEAGEQALGKAAAALTKRRKAAGARLARAVDEVLPDLGMPDGHLEVALRPRGEVGAEGAEDVEFLVSLNVGHDARPLARVASGGELSRVMLALKTILARLDHVPTLVFDEVDAGIGGTVGLQVSDTMRRVAASHQVFAITHLPQIAARAHHHIRVSKDAAGGVTTAGIAVLEGEARVVEIARMLGGDPDSAVSRAHARELLKSAAAPAAPPDVPRGGAGRPRRRP
ncbi:MAG: DNA repair protein RecN [Gemmatimonadota bacterium]|nr:DNA repair protein RecN [Gemmatimonadota bacterium]